MREIEIEGLGVMRLCNSWQVNHIQRMRPGRNKLIAPAAFGLGMTLQQFKKLPIGQQEVALVVYSQLAFPARSSTEGHSA